MKRRRKLPPGVSSFVDRHGTERFRWRRKGHKTIYLKGHPGTPPRPSEEVQRLNAIGSPISAGADRILPGTVDDLVSRFYLSSYFAEGSADRQRVVRGIIEPFRAEFGGDRVADFTFAHIEAVGGKVAAYSLKKQLRRLFKLAVKLGMVASNPVELAEGAKKPKSSGFHTWTEEEIAAFQKRHKLGTKARLALEILLWTWMRRGDARLFGRKHLKDGRIGYTQGKGKKTLYLPAAPQLLAAIQAMPAVGIDTFIVTEFGKPFTAAGFGNWFRDRCDEAGLSHCSAHGLRKAGARRAAEGGATQQGLKAVGGWSNDAEVATYTAAADQVRLAGDTLGRLFKGEDGPTVG